MEFSDKFNTVISLISVKNNVIAKTVNVDPSLISRLRTGARGIPRDQKLLRRICDCISGYIESGYMLTALYDLTKDRRLCGQCNKSELSDVIYAWLNSDAENQYYRVKTILDSVNDFTDTDTDKSQREESLYTDIWHSKTNIYKYYYTNKGKREALLNFFDYASAIEKPSVIKVFSDETDEWIMEDKMYIHEISHRIEALAKKGFKVQRILPPQRSMESMMCDVERWLPAYITGSVQIYSYPWARDEFHRMTSITVPGKLVLHSMSLYGQKEPFATMITSNPASVAAHDRYFDGILERCNRMANVYTSNDRRKVLRRLEEILQLENFGISKSKALSAYTLPKDVIERIKLRALSSTNDLLDCYMQSGTISAKILNKYMIIDIMSMPKLENVIKGTEPVPGMFTEENNLFYTVREYKKHLEHILWYLENYKNYRVVLLEEHELENIVLYIKGNERSLLIKESSPFTLYEITQPQINVAIISYLKSVADQKCSLYRREETVKIIKSEIYRIESAVSL